MFSIRKLGQRIARSAIQARGISKSSGSNENNSKNDSETKNEEKTDETNEVEFEEVDEDNVPIIVDVDAGDLFFCEKKIVIFPDIDSMNADEGDTRADNTLNSLLLPLPSTSTAGTLLLDEILPSATSVKSKIKILSDSKYKGGSLKEKRGYLTENNKSVDDDDDDDEEEEEEEELEGAVGGSTDAFVAAYLMKQEYADKQTNTECAFPPEKSRSSQQQQMSDDRPVKRSQTFTPSAAVGKNRYICRLNRSDSDSAMHFGVTPHPFHRGAIERRSLRIHPKAPKSVTKLHHTHIPRTSLDLELDLQAQHSKLYYLNDEISKLQNLKETLEKARDNMDPLIASWAMENEEFQRLVERADPSKCPEEKQLQKLLIKTTKEIYKLRKTKVPKGCPDLVSFKEKISFFTRKGLSVPELPLDFLIPEADSIEEEEEEEEDDDEDNAAETAIAINTALVASSNRNKNLSDNHSGGRREIPAYKCNAISMSTNVTTAPTQATQATPTITATVPTLEKTLTNNTTNNENDDVNPTETPKDGHRYTYVVDPTYGVEV
ncbi:protein kibra-like [Teleopsis dalmanni]|uniref:protein kibra-like n=1 Tax=Teleopsis dalmanni TaxID=139649 RepID=UPI0018CEEC11|nr:protein kibra-like [Teleopsis dalmanni]